MDIAALQLGTGLAGEPALAMPCTGPSPGGVPAFALTRPPAVIIATFLAVGLGLALPCVISLMRPSLFAKLPRPAAWTVRVRQGLAVVLPAAAVFFAQSPVPAGLGRGLWLDWLMLPVAWAGFVLLRFTGRGARTIGPVFAIADATFVYGGGLHPWSRNKPC